MTNDAMEDVTLPRAKTGFTRFLPSIARVLLGLVFLVFGANGFFHFIPQPEMKMSEKATAFITGLMGTGYMEQLMSGTQVIVGILLLTNCFVPLALALIAPFIVNVFAFHAFLEHSGIVIAIVISLLEIYLAWAYRNAFRPMLKLKTIPS